MFDVNITMQNNNIWKFIIGESSLQEMVNFVIIWEISYRYSNLETGRCGLNSPGFNPGELSALQESEAQLVAWDK